MKINLSLPLPYFFFFLMYFFLQQTVTPPPNLNTFQPHNKSDHHNTQFVSIRVLIQILLRILHFKSTIFFYLNSILKC
jgi:hypothetical protein